MADTKLFGRTGYAHNSSGRTMRFGRVNCAINRWREIQRYNDT